MSSSLFLVDLDPVVSRGGAAAQGELPIRQRTARQSSSITEDLHPDCTKLLSVRHRLKVSERLISDPQFFCSLYLFSYNLFSLSNGTNCWALESISLLFYYLSTTCTSPDLKQIWLRQRQITPGFICTHTHRRCTILSYQLINRKHTYMTPLSWAVGLLQNCHWLCLILGRFHTCWFIRSGQKEMYCCLLFSLPVPYSKHLKNVNMCNMKNDLFRDPVGKGYGWALPTTTQLLHFSVYGNWSFDETQFCLGLCTI